VDVSDPGVECKAYECVENGPVMRVICRLNALQGPKGGPCEAELAALGVINGKDMRLATHDNFKWCLSDASPTGC
jgi:hypothetical protein